MNDVSSCCVPLNQGGRSERLEPCASKGARTVLRGGGAGNSASLPDLLRDMLRQGRFCEEYEHDKCLQRNRNGEPLRLGPQPASTNANFMVGCVEIFYSQTRDYKDFGLRLRDRSLYRRTWQRF